MTRATDALNNALATFAALPQRQCIEPGCTRTAPDPGKRCDQCLRVNAPADLRAEWDGPAAPDQWARDDHQDDDFDPKDFA